MSAARLQNCSLGACSARFAHSPNEYRTLLDDDETFSSAAIEDLLSAKVLAPKTIAALRRRYVSSPPDAG